MPAVKIPVLVTAVGGGGFGEQILKALCIANKEHNKYYIIAGDMNPYCPQFQMADESVCLPAASHEDYVNILMSICKKKECQALFPGNERELTEIAKCRSVIEDTGILLLMNPTNVIETCMDKNKAGLVLDELGFKPPRFKEARKFEELVDIDWFPVVIKPSSGAGGSAHCYIAQTIEELKYLVLYLNTALPNQPFIVQEYVGDELSEYTVGILNDLDGNYINSIALHRELKNTMNVRAKYKNNTDRKELGNSLIVSSGISHGYIGKFPEVTDKCRELAMAIGAKGAINIQVRFVDGEIKVFEINPRFSGTTSLRAMMGYNEPDILLRKHILGETIETDFEFKEGMILRNLVETEMPDTPAASWEQYLNG
tara:strand:- start:1064 stop:2173 length:1110 start_codon:yes stop_codon:yes gene_type:complete